MRELVLTYFLLFSVFYAVSQEFSREDSLRGNLTPIRTCYDVTFYDLFLMIDEEELSLEYSYNIIHFTAISNFEKIQIDLVPFLQKFPYFRHNILNQRYQILL